MATDQSSISHRVAVAGAKSIICTDPEKVVSKGFWFGRQPLHYSTPLLLLQLSLISITSILIDFCLQPLGQSTIVSHIFGGVVFGPSLLGHSESISSALFPMRGNMMLETAACFGLMFLFFEIGVKIEGGLIMRPGKVAAAIGLAVTFVPLGLAFLMTLLLQANVAMDDSLSQSLPVIAASQCLTAFPNIAWLLHELKILHTDLARLTLTAAVLSDAIAIFMITLFFSVIKTPSALQGVFSFASTVALFVVILYAFRPAFVWINSHVSERKGVGETYISLIFAGVLLTGLAGEIIGQHFILGPVVLGMVVPEGPPLGAALIGKIDCLISGVFYRTFLTVSGLKTNLFKIRFRSAWIVFALVIFVSLTKIFVVLAVGRFSHMPWKEALVLGLLLNARGICQLVLYNIWRDSNVLGDEEFTLSVLSLIGVTAVIVPLIRFLYDPAGFRLPMRRRTIQQAKRDGELRILVCIHNQDNVPTMVNLLEASWATTESPVAIVALLLVQLVGRTVPMLIPHQPQQNVDVNLSMSRSGHIINALHQYELYNEGAAAVQAFSAISHMETMHEFISKVALDQNVAIVIVPFHKHWAIDGEIGSANRVIQHMNAKVLEKAPCSVGILVDRGILNGSLSIINGQSPYHVAVIYIGGPDDAESLCYGARMVNHRSVTLTVIRYLLFGADNARERKFDTDLINEVRHANNGNDAFLYREEVVRDGAGFTACIRELENCFDLIMVGRNHQDSALVRGLGAWSECPEIGVIGDFLASPDFGGAASVLVVQQQNAPGGRMVTRPMRPVGNNDREVPLHRLQSQCMEAAAGGNNGGAWTVTVDRL